tara:strand:+ start:5372 stop:6436 length:1065 start_codon:yes stop_codon:yes gene_type:complete
MKKSDLRRIVRHVINEDTSSQLPKLSKILFEQEEEGQEKKEASGKIGDAPKGTSVDKTTNVKDVDAVEIANQLLSGDDDAPIVAITKGEWYETNGAQAKEWIEKIGPETFVKRLNTLASKIPSTGLPKSVMPFLPGPEDAKGEVSDVEDALTPGGDYNIDVTAPFKEAAWKVGARALMEQEEEKEESSNLKGGEPPPPNKFVGMDAPGAKEFMTAGLDDGDDTDDKIEIKAGGSLNASDAIPTQSNILIYKALGMAMNPKNQIAGGDLDAWAGTNGEILDGHHRWAATMFNDPSASMGTAGQVNLQALGDPQKTLKFLTAIGNALGNKTKTESRTRNSGNILLERWNKLAGTLS